MRVRRWSVAAISAAAMLAGCGEDAPRPAATVAAVASLEPSEPFGLTTVTVRAPDKRVALSLPAYDAYTEQTRARGLMHRAHLPRRAGMVFRFAQDRDGGFYMKNTLIPLAVVFFDQGGTVVGVREMQPCTTPSCPTYRPDARYRGALELNLGFARRIGVRRGWHVEVPAGLPRPE